MFVVLVKRSLLLKKFRPKKSGGVWTQNCKSSENQGWLQLGQLKTLEKDESRMRSAEGLFNLTLSSPYNSLSSLQDLFLPILFVSFGLAFFHFNLFLRISHSISGLVEMTAFKLSQWTSTLDWEKLGEELRGEQREGGNASMEASVKQWMKEPRTTTITPQATTS